MTRRSPTITVDRGSLSVAVLLQYLYYSGTMGRVRAAVRLGAVLTVGVVAACANAVAPAADSPSASSSSSSSASSAVRPASAAQSSAGTSGSDPAADPGADPSAAPVAASAAAPPATPVDAALTLQALLGEHSVLAADMMRARIRGDADLAQTANAAVGSNSAALGRLLTPVLGASGASRFSTLWANHVQAFFTYARGLSAQDRSVQDSARAVLVTDESRLADLLATASHGRLRRAAALDAVRTHIDHLLDGADAYAARDYATSATLYRAGYGHAVDLGGTLAHALLPAAVGRKLDTPAVQLRSALTKLLGEHVVLVVASMRSAVGEPADFTAMGAAVNGNTTDLAQAIDGLFGAAAAKRFQSLWADHVDQLMAYTSATVRGDTAGQATARTALRTFEQDFATFLDTATQHRLGEPALARAFVMHDRMLLAEIDAYAAKSYEEAHRLADDTFTDMFTVSGRLAAAIGATVAGKLPRGGSQTGGGGTAHRAVR
jgi:hypothetical protein